MLERIHVYVRNVKTSKLLDDPTSITSILCYNADTRMYHIVRKTSAGSMLYDTTKMRVSVGFAHADELFPTFNGVVVDAYEILNVKERFYPVLFLDPHNLIAQKKVTLDALESAFMPVVGSTIDKQNLLETYKNIGILVEDTVEET